MKFLNAGGAFTALLLIIFLTVASPFQARAEALLCADIFDDVGDLPLVEHLLKLSSNEALEAQKSSVLNHIAGPNRGLCYSTCLLNMSLAIIDALKIDKTSQRFQSYSKQSFDFYKQIFDLIASREVGETWRSSRAQTLPEFFRQTFGTGKIIEVEIHDRNQGEHPDLSISLLSPSRDSLVMPEFKSGPRSSHVVLVVSLDIQEKKMSYIDPNHPLEVIETTLEVTSGGQIFIDWGGRYQLKKGELVSTMRASVNRREAANQIRFRRFQKLLYKTTSVTLAHAKRVGSKSSKFLKNAVLMNVRFDEGTGETALEFKVPIGAPETRPYYEGVIWHQPEERVLVDVSEIKDLKLKKRWRSQEKEHRIRMRSD